MGEFFREEEQREVKKEERLIEDPQELFTAYNILTNKIQMMTNEGYETIMPIRAELTGTKQTPDDTGQIGNLRRRIESSRISRMEIGTMMWSALKNIEDLDRWSERYIKYLEDYLDAMKLITKSSFKIISNLYGNINKMQNRINELQARKIPIKKEPATVPPVKYLPKKRTSPSIKTVADEDTPSFKEDVPIEEKEPAHKDIFAPPHITQISFPEPKPIPPKKPDIDVFNSLIDSKIEEYRQARKTGDEKQIEEGRAQIYKLCGRNKLLKRKVESLIIRIDMEG